MIMYVTILAWCEYCLYNQWVYRLETIMLKYCIIILFWNSSMVLLLFPCMQVLLVCLYYAHFIIEKTPRTWGAKKKCSSDWHLSLSALHRRCCQNVTVLMLVVTLSKFSQLTLPNLFAAICPCILPLFRHNAQMLLACNYSYIMLSIIDSSLPVRHVYIYWCKLTPLPACTELLSTWHLFSQYLNRAVTLALDYWVLNNSQLSD